MKTYLGSFPEGGIDDSEHGKRLLEIVRKLFKQCTKFLHCGVRTMTIYSSKISQFL